MEQQQQQLGESLKSEERFNKIDNILTKYINVLDIWQREVDDIRQFHHDVWAKTQQHEVIIQHRTGSRVEKQTRIVDYGKQTNIDFMFEVNGLNVGCDDNSTGIYFKPSDESKLFGKVFITKDMQEELQTNERYSTVFSDGVFRWDESEQAFLLKPSCFRDQVMTNSGFEYKRNVAVSKKGPSVPGKGIVNEYDAVPCLRLLKWPNSVSHWVEGEFEVFPRDWKKGIVAKNVPIFVVPTGNPNSPHSDDEFRLSFSMIEIEYFSKMNDNIRRKFGITKYVFQSLFESSVDILSWFHIKYLLLNMVMHKECKSLSPIQFVFEAFQFISQSIKQRIIQHIFIDDCNIFPIYKLLTEKSEIFYDDIIDGIESKVLDLLEEHLKNELKITKDNKTWFEDVEKALVKCEDQLSLQEYVDGYLTRLLSVITFPLCREDRDKAKDVKKIQETFLKYGKNKNIARIVPMVNATIRRITGDNSLDISVDTQPQDDTSDSDKLSILAHKVFENIIRDQTFENIPKYLPDDFDDTFNNDHEIGVSVSRYHRNLILIDAPLQHVMSSLETMYGTCPRFYVHPILMLKHLYLLYYFNFLLPNDPTNELFLRHLQDLINVSLKMSPRAPYFGKLSYRFSAVYLLNGYKDFLKNHNIDFEFKFNLVNEMKAFDTPRVCGSFDLK